MNQNDYYIAFDENGTPYIEHGIFDNVKNAVKNAANKVTSTVSNAAKGVGRGVRANHKYLLKVFENGKTRYFYKQSEVDAYYRAKKAGIKNAAEYVQNKAKNAGTSAKDMINKAKETVKATADKVTGASANKNVETAKQSAADASRWAKMAERVHKENMDAFKQNPTEANLARAKQSGQAVTKANQNVKNAKEAVNDAKTKAAWHPANIAKDIASEAKKSVDSAGDKVQQTVKDLTSTIKQKTGIQAKEDVSNAKKAVEQATKDYDRAEKERREATKNGEADSHGQKWYKTEAEAKRAGDAELNAERAKNEITNRKNDLSGAQSRYDDTLLGKAEKATSSAKDMVDKAKSAVKDKATDIQEKAYETKRSAKDMIDKAKSAVKDTAEKATSSTKNIIDQAKKAAKDNSVSNFTREQEQTNTGSRQIKRTQEEMNEMRNHQKANGISKEYEEELAYNSQKNNSSSTNTTAKPKSSTNDIDVDPTKVSAEYIMERAYNSGMSTGKINKLKEADEAFEKAARAYARVENSPNISSQEKDRLSREMTKAEKAYYKIADEVITDFK